MRGLLTDLINDSSQRPTLKAKAPAPKPKSPLARIPPAAARVLTAFVLLPFLVVSIIFPRMGLLFVVLTDAAMLVALFEFWLLAGKQQVRADVAAGGPWPRALVLTFFFFPAPGRPRVTCRLARPRLAFHP